jgi:hypothetical protein
MGVNLYNKAAYSSEITASVVRHKFSTVGHITDVRSTKFSQC